MIQDGPSIDVSIGQDDSFIFQGPEDGTAPFHSVNSPRQRQGVESEGIISASVTPDIKRSVALRSLEQESPFMGSDKQPTVGDHMLEFSHLGETSQHLDVITYKTGHANLSMLQLTQQVLQDVSDKSDHVDSIEEVKRHETVLLADTVEEACQQAEGNDNAHLDRTASVQQINDLLFILGETKLPENPITLYRIATQKGENWDLEGENWYEELIAKKCNLLHRAERDFHRLFFARTLLKIGKKPDQTFQLLHTSIASIITNGPILLTQISSILTALYNLYGLNKWTTQFKKHRHRCQIFERLKIVIKAHWFWNYHHHEWLNSRQRFKLSISAYVISQKQQIDCYESFISAVIGFYRWEIHRTMIKYLRATCFHLYAIHLPGIGVELAPPGEVSLTADIILSDNPPNEHSSLDLRSVWFSLQGYVLMSYIDKAEAENFGKTLESFISKFTSEELDKTLSSDTWTRPYLQDRKTAKLWKRTVTNVVAARKAILESTRITSSSVSTAHTSGSGSTFSNVSHLYGSTYSDGSIAGVHYSDVMDLNSISE
jgi:hypothetical protein